MTEELKTGAAQADPPVIVVPYSPQGGTLGDSPLTLAAPRRPRTQEIPKESNEATMAMEVYRRAATDPGVDVEKLKQITDMCLSLLDRAAEKQFIADFCEMQKELPSVVKDAWNPQTRSRYARLESIDKAIKPILAKYGFFTSFGTKPAQKPDHYCVTMILGHRGGHLQNYESGDLPKDLGGMRGSANKTETHAFGSTMTYGQRYVKKMALDITLEGEDSDGNKEGYKSREGGGRKGDVPRDDSANADSGLDYIPD